MVKPEVQFEQKLRSSGKCDYELKSTRHHQEHIDVSHLVPHRKKIQQKLIAAYKCDECELSVPTRSSLRAHINLKHRKLNKGSINAEENVKGVLLVKSNVEAAKIQW